MQNASGKMIVDNSTIPHGMDLKLNIPSASDTAWQRGFLSPEASPNPWGQSTMETSSECKYIWTPTIGFPYKRKQNEYYQTFRTEKSLRVLDGGEPNQLKDIPTSVSIKEHDNFLLTKADAGRRFLTSNENENREIEGSPAQQQIPWDHNQGQRTCHPPRHLQIQVRPTGKQRYFTH